MGQSLVESAVRGMFKPVLTPEQRKLLTEGDIEGILELHRSMFGLVSMKDDDDSDDDSDDDDSDDDDSDDDDSDDDDSDDDDSDDDDSEGKKKKKVDPKDTRIQELSSEARAKRLRIRSQKARIAELERENAALKGKKSDKDDDDDEDVASVEAASKLEKANRTNEDLLIRLEFMASKKWSWKNPKSALKLLDFSEVEIADDGEVEGLEEAMDELAKSDPYLLDSSKDDKGERKNRRQGATGQSTRGQRKVDTANRDKLLSKYPALRR